MRRRAVSYASLGVIGAAALALAGISRLGGRGSSPADVPLYDVRLGAFARQITAEGTLKAVKATPVTAPIEAQRPLKIAWMAPDGSPVKKGEVIARFDPTDFQKQLEEGKREDETAWNKMTKAQAQARAARENLRRDSEQAERELSAARTFQKKDAEIFSRSQIIESDIDEKLASEKLQYSENVREVRNRLSRAEGDLLSIEQRKARIKIRQAEQGLGALEVRAPHEGILVLRRDWRGELARVGETVWSGQTLGEIPDLSSMQAEVFVLEADGGGLAVGQTARVVVESSPERPYEARISRMDPLAKPRMRNVPVQYFSVTLELARTDPAVMKPGARVAASLRIQERENVLSVPLQAIFEKDGKKVAYRRRGGTLKPAEVTVGPSSLGRIVIEKGLSAGDRVALRDPAKPPAKSDETAPAGWPAGGAPKQSQ